MRSIDHTRNVRSEIEITGFPTDVRTGQTFLLAGLLRDAGLHDHHQLTVDWGDGTPPEVFAINPANRTFNLHHIYAKPGPKRIKLTASDNAGSSVTKIIRSRIRPSASFF